MLDAYTAYKCMDREIAIKLAVNFLLYVSYVPSLGRR